MSEHEGEEMKDQRRLARDSTLASATLAPEAAAPTIVPQGGDETWKEDAIEEDFVVINRAGVCDRRSAALSAAEEVTTAEPSAQDWTNVSEREVAATASVDKKQMQQKKNEREEIYSRTDDVDTFVENSPDTATLVSAQHDRESAEDGRWRQEQLLSVGTTDALTRNTQEVTEGKKSKRKEGRESVYDEGQKKVETHEQADEVVTVSSAGDSEEYLPANCTEDNATGDTPRTNLHENATTPEGADRDLSSLAAAVAAVAAVTSVVDTIVFREDPNIRNTVARSSQRGSAGGDSTSSESAEDASDVVVIEADKQSARTSVDPPDPHETQNEQEFAALLVGASTVDVQTSSDAADETPDAKAVFREPDYAQESGEEDLFAGAALVEGDELVPSESDTISATVDDFPISVEVGVVHEGFIADNGVLGGVAVCTRGDVEDADAPSDVLVWTSSGDSYPADAKDLPKAIESAVGLSVVDTETKAVEGTQPGLEAVDGVTSPAESVGCDLGAAMGQPAPTIDLHAVGNAEFSSPEKVDQDASPSPTTPHTSMVDSISSALRGTKTVQEPESGKCRR